MQFIRSILVQDESIDASDVKTYDLPVNPLSHIILSLTFDNVTDEATKAEALERLEKIEVLYKGASVWSLNGIDLWAIDGILFKDLPILTNQVATEDVERAITLIIPMGRKIMDPEECFPATKKGELSLRLTFSATETACDELVLQVETTELIGATPKQHIKVTTISKTPSATGEHEVPLAVGNKYAGVMLWGTTIPTGAGVACSIEWMKTKIDGVEKDFAQTNWESLHGELLNRIGHREAYDGSADDDDLTAYSYLDFDPRDSDLFLLETAGKAEFELTINAGVADAIRILPVELVAV